MAPCEDTASAFEAFIVRPCWSLQQHAGKAV